MVFNPNFTMRIDFIIPFYFILNYEIILIKNNAKKIILKKLKLCIFL
jgi:hypothetical protein